MTRAAIIVRCVATVGLLLAASTPSLACRQASRKDAEELSRQDLVAQRVEVRQLVREADSVHVAVAVKTPRADDDVELDIVATLRGARPAQSRRKFPPRDTVTVGCSRSAFMRDVDIRKGRTYVVYIARGELLRAGDRRRDHWDIPWKEETSLARSLGRWTMPPARDSFAETDADFEAARARWQATRLSNYSFAWRWGGGVIIAPACADADIRVRVASGKSIAPVVEHGSARCPRGLRGEPALGMNVPTSIDAVFEQVGRLVDMGVDQVRIHATYDDTYGIPLSFYAEKLETFDDDEGFEITNFVPGP